MFKKKSHFTVPRWSWRDEYEGFWPGYSWCFRSILRTHQRLAYEIGIKHDYRGLIKFEPPTNIPDKYDDIYIGCETKSWKRVSRCKKQWEVNLK